MTSLRVATAALALTATAFTGVSTQQTDDFCAPSPPPRGLVARCQSLTLTVPASEAALRAALTDWMRTCVSKGRAAALVEGADDSVAHAWNLMKDLPRTRTVTILPEYEPLTFTRAGQTCYGVDTVSFLVKGAQGAVDLDGPVDVTPVPQPTGLVMDPTDEQIKEAAKAATKALLDSDTRSNSGLPRFRGVLEGMAKYGKDFDDTWYNVAPAMGGLDACYTFVGRCVPSDEALKNCTRRLRVDIVSHYEAYKDRPEKFREALEITNSSLFRAFQHFRQLHARDTGLDLCESVKAMMPRVSDHARKGDRALYFYY